MTGWGLSRLCNAFLLERKGEEGRREITGRPPTFYAGARPGLTWASLCFLFLLMGQAYQRNRGRRSESPVPPLSIFRYCAITKVAPLFLPPEAKLSQTAFPTLAAENSTFSHRKCTEGLPRARFLSFLGYCEEFASGVAFLFFFREKAPLN